VPLVLYIAYHSFMYMYVAIVSIKMCLSINDVSVVVNTKQHKKG